MNRIALSAPFSREIKGMLATAVPGSQSGIACGHMDEYALGIAVDDVPEHGWIHEQLPIVLVRAEVERHALRCIAFSHELSADCCHVTLRLYRTPADILNRMSLIAPPLPLPVLNGHSATKSAYAGKADIDHRRSPNSIFDDAR
jgi:hypothetical protein